MLNSRETGLSIFDNFQIDFNLQKWQTKKATMGSDGAISVPLMVRNRSGLASPGGVILPSSSPINNGIVFGGFIGTPTPAGTAGLGANTHDKPDAFSFISTLVKNVFNRRKIKALRRQAREGEKISNFMAASLPGDAYSTDSKEPELTVGDFFKSIKNSSEELVLLSDRIKNYESVIDHLKATGQQALYEQMSFDMESHRSESQLYASGHRKIITEANVIEFAKLVTRKIRLDWIRNYVRCIPSKAVDLKRKLDDLHIFDNYVVMHFDPENTGSAMTEDDKDPILFGVIFGQHKLYYVADWIDEYCDLTFDKMVETLGEAAISANDITANVSVPCWPEDKPNTQDQEITKDEDKK
jgi:hypothetical protein